MNNWQKQLITGDFVAYEGKIYKIRNNNIDRESLVLEGYGYVCYDDVSRLDGGERNVDVDSLLKNGGGPSELYIKLIETDSSEYKDMEDYNDVLHYFQRHGQNLPPPIL